MSLLLFLILQLARSQGTVSPNARRNHASDDEALQRLYLPDVLSIAVLDVLHSLLALAGATDGAGLWLINPPYPMGSIATSAPGADTQ